MFELKNVCLVYDIGKEEVTYALRNINITTKSNGILGIMGPSGSGKSSLLYIMSGLKNPTSGEVIYNGIVMNQLFIDDKANLRREKFGFVFQRGYLIDYLSVLDNILVPVNSSSEKYKAKAMDLLEKLGIAKLASKKPYQLSGGQRQRVVIARALINDPEVIFADEPTAALDHAAAADVMRVLGEYSKDKLVVVVTHDTSILSGVDNILTIWDGRLENKAGERT